VPLGQPDNPFLDRDRSQPQLTSIDLAPAELAPQPEQSGMLRQRVTTEAFYGAAFGEFQDPQQIPLEMRPTELGFALVIFQIGAESITAQDSLKHGPSRSTKTSLPRVAAMV
jgi:hypothetical protein